MKRVLFAVAMALLAAAPAWAQKLSVDDAVKLLHDNEAMRAPDKRKAVEEAFAGLPADQAAAAVPKLLPALGAVQGRAIPPLRQAFLNLGEPAISPLVDTLGQDDLWPGTLQVLPYFREKAVPVVVGVLGNENPAVRTRALVVLGNIAGRPINLRARPEMLAVVPAIAQRLGDASAPVVVAAAEALQAMGPQGKQAVDALVAALRHEEPGVRVAVATALGAMKAEAVAASPALAALLEDTDAKVRHAAVKALGEVGSPRAAALKVLAARRADVAEPLATRMAALETMMKISKEDLPGAVAELTRALGDANDAAALHAARMLAQIGAPALDALSQALKDNDARMRRFAAFALAKMGAAAKPALPLLTAALKDGDDLVRRNAAEAIGRIGDAASADALKPVLKDDSLRVRLAAAAALRRLAPQDPALADFRQALVRDNRTEAEPDDIGKFPPERYMNGGPMAGLELPRFPSQLGAPAGFPGCIPALNQKWAAEHPDLATDDEPLNDNFTPVGQAPELHLYPGAVEHWRGEMMKYMPQRSFFDAQSQLKRWTAPEIPGASPAQRADYAAPISWMPRWAGHVKTGLNDAPVPVVRWGAANRPIALDCGRLPRGVYCVRLVAAVPAEKITFFRVPLLLQMKVNDGLNNEVNTYVKRENYTDEFYSLGEFYFHAPETRDYRVELSVPEGIETELLVHDVILDDAFAGMLRRPVKTRMTLNRALDEKIAALIANPVEKRFAGMLQEERDVRDAWLWESFPRDNMQSNRPYRLPARIKNGTLDMEPGEIVAQHGAWNHTVYGGGNAVFNPTPADPTAWLVNNKTGSTYALSDRAAQRPLPDPYPFKDIGCALAFRQPDGSAGAYWSPIADVVQDFHWSYPTVIHNSVEQWIKSGDESYARDASVSLARWAYALPTLDSTAALLHGNFAEVSSLGEEFRFRRRATTSNFYRWYTEYASEIMDDYDRLFDYLKDNWEVAQSVNRFVPWVQTPRDVQKLLDVYLVQTTTKRMLRYNWFTGEMNLARLATMVGDTNVTDPWMEFLFARTFVYPFPVAGLPDLMVSGCSREGPEYVASTMYAGGENALPKATGLVEYLENGGNPKFDLSNPLRYPKPVSTCYWLMERLVGGLNYIRIGDVCGPDKYYGGVFAGLDDASYWGWRWTKDPRFAFLRKHYFGKKDFSDADWAAIEQAAAQVKRAPWLDQPSRVMPQWAAVLESGRQHDDQRFRRALFLRSGMGWGHHHNDGLDLEVYAHGVMMTCDAGQRPSYSKPADRSTRMHNLVEVDGLTDRDGEWLGHNWTRALSDADGAKYVMQEATVPNDFPAVKLYQRQVALIDVDEGKGSQPLAPELCRPNSPLPKDVTTGNSYVFDVFRVSGGRRHTYSFHANRSDAVTHNLPNALPIDQAPEKDQSYVRRMAGERLAGDAPENLQITWQIEQTQVNADLRPNTTATPHFTRLHLPGEQGARVLRGSLHCTQFNYMIPMAFIQRRSADEDAENAKADLESAFAAIIEPYVAKPFVSEVRPLSVGENETDARRAVALGVKTTNGHEDICFADGRPEKTRSVGALSVAGEFAYLSRDADGLRVASLTGGTLLQTPEITIKPTVREYYAAIARVDYPARKMFLDTPWPAIDAASQPFIFEVGKGNHWTAYTATDIKPTATGTEVTLLRGADYYLSRVKEIDAKTNTVVCALGFGSGPGGGGIPTPGIDKDWVASNDDATKFWRAEYLGGNIGLARYDFKLTGDPATLEDFGASKAFRLWEYGPGDRVRHSTFASVRRIEPGVYEVTADVDVAITLRGKTVTVTLADLKKNGGKVALTAP